MIEEQAIVVSLQGDDVQLEIVRKTPCGLCGKTRGCGVSMWGKLAGHRHGYLSASNGIAAKVGDTVVVGIADDAIAKSAIQLYGLPLLGLILGALIANQFMADGASQGSRDAYTAGGALLGFILSMIWLKANIHKASGSIDIQPVLLGFAENPIHFTCERSQ